MLDHQPDARNLLETALAAFRQEILPTLADEHRFTGLMIANALSTAIREIGRERTEEEALAAGLSALLGQDGTDLPGLLAGTAQAIADGRFDREPAATRLHDVLLALTEARLRVTNPKMLQSGT